MSLIPAFSFAAFVFWLLALPMDGPLAAAAGVLNPSLWFLPGHILALTLAGLVPPAIPLRRLVPAAVPGVMLLTFATALWPDGAPLLLFLLGICAAPLLLAAGQAMSGAANPALQAAIGLIAGNSALFLLTIVPSSLPWGRLIAALPLLLFLRQPYPDHPPLAIPTTVWRYLPLVLIYHLSGGLMYGHLFPAYQRHAVLPGLELIFYVAAVGIALRLVRNRLETPLVCGFFFAMLAFILLQWGPAVNAGMFAMQTGAGFVDLFLLAFLLRRDIPLRAFAFGNALLCLGLFAGGLLGRHLDAVPQGITTAGNLVLYASLLLLFLAPRSIGRPNDDEVEEVVEKPPPLGDDVQPAAVTQMPCNIRLLLSERECLVLSHSLTGQTYRETAEKLAISESSVKTYMKRIYEKLEVSGRKELLQRLANL